MHHLLLLHGAAGSATQMKALENILREDYEVHCPDLPGHGNHSSEKAFSIPFFAGYIKDYCDKKQLDTINIFGYSMGGYIAFYLAKKHPGWISRVVTLATKFDWNETIASKEIEMLQADVIERKVPQFARVLEQRHAANNWKLVLEKTAIMLSGLGRRNEINAQDLPGIETQSLLMLGDRDKMVSLEETVSIFKSMPHASMAILPGTPHPLEQADPELIAFFIRKFID
jgi:pimeloyl-ACP methyl ester carboxylesterase